MLVAADQNGKIISWNPAAEMAFGYSETEILGCDLTDIIPERYRAAHEKGYAKAIKNGEFASMGESVELEGLKKDGTEFPIEISPGTWKKDDEVFFSAVIIDISDRKLAEEEVLKTQALYNQAERLGKLGHWEWDEIEQRLAVCSEEYARIYDMSVDELLSKAGTHEDDLNYFHPDDRQRYVELEQHCRTTNNKLDIEYRLISEAGIERYVHELGEYELDENGVLVRSFGTLQDITERKLAEQQLHLNQFTVEHNTDEVFWMNADGKILYANQGACNKLGYSQDEFKNMTLADFDPEFERDDWAEHWQDLKQAGHILIESTHQSKTGEIFPVEVLIDFFDYEGNEYICSHVRDISERKQAQQDMLLGQTAIEQAAIENAGDAIFWLDHEDASFIYANNAACQVLGYSNEELLNRTIIDVDPSRSLERLHSAWEEVKREGTMNYSTQTIRKNGELFDAELTVTCVAQEDKEYICTILRDVTRRKDAERALQESEERHRSLVETMNHGMSTVGIDGCLSYVNDIGCEIFGYPHEELIGEPLSKLVAEEDQPVLLAAIERRKEQVIHPYEITLTQKSGSKVDVIVAPATLFDKEGNYQGILATITDITERNKAELALRESEEKHRTLVESMNHGMVMIDLEARITYVNQKSDDLFGYPHDELIGMSLLKLVADDQLDLLLAQMEKRKLGLTDPYEIAWIQKNGTRVESIVAAASLYDKDGIRSGTLATITDITERKASELILKQSEERLANSQRMARVGNWHLDTTSGEMSLSDEMCRIYGLSTTEREITASRLIDVVHPDDRGKMHDDLENIQASGTTINAEYRVIRPDGSEHYVSSMREVSSDENGNVIGIAGTVQDITERKLADIALSESEELLRHFFDAKIVGMMIIGTDMQWIQVNDEFCRMTGYTRDEVMKFSWVDITHPDDLESDRLLYEEVLTGQRDGYSMEKRYFHKDGHIVPITLFVECVRNEDGSPKFYVVFNQDDSVRKRIEKEAQESELRYKRLVDIMQEGLNVVDANFNITFFNQRLCDMLGYTLEEVIGKSATHLYHDDDREIIDWQIAERQQGRQEPYEISWTCKDGSKLLTLLSPNVIYDKEGNFIGSMAVVSDITERKRNEQALLFTQTAVDNAGDAISWMNVEGKYVYLNDAVCEAYGYSREEMMSMSIEDLDPDYDLTKWNEFWQELKSKEAMRVESQPQKKTGDRFDAEITTTMVESEGEHFMCAILRDVTERKKIDSDLKASEQRARLYFNTGLLGMSIINKDFKHLETNEAQCKMLGYSPKEYDKLTMVDFTHKDDLEMEMEYLHKLETGEISRYTIDKRFIHKNGNTVYAILSAECLHDANGNVKYYVAFVQDITARKKSEEALQITQTAVDNSSDGIFWIKSDARFIYSNDAACLMYGYSQEEMRSSYVWDLDPNRDQGVWMDHWQDLKRDRSLNIETKNRKKNGELFDVELLLSFIEFRGEEYLCATIRDITERKATENAIRKSEERARLYFNTSSLGMLIVDSNLQVEDVNDIHCDMLGYTRKELFEVSWPDFTHPDDVEREKEYFSRLQSGAINSYNLEKRFVRKNGEILYGHLKVESIRNTGDEPDYYIGFIQDISERKLAEEALKKSEELLRYFFDAKVIGMMLVDMDMNWLQVNDQFCDMLGYTQDEMKQLTWAGLTHPEDLDNNTQLYEDTIAGLRDGYNIQKRYVHKNGESVHINLSVECVRNADGKPNFFIAFVEDITKRVISEREAHESELRFKRLVDTMQEGLNVVDTDFNIAFSNESLCKMLGYSLDELIGRPAIDLFDGDDLEITKQQIELRKEGEYNTYEVAWTRKDGSKVQTVLSPRPAYDSEGKFIGSIGVVTDITEQKRIEEELAVSEVRFDAAFANTVIAMSINKIEGPYVTVNPAMCTFTGYTEEELLTKTNLDITYPDDQEETVKNCQYLIDGHADHFLMEKRYVNKAGEIRWDLLSLAIVRDDNSEPLYFVPQIQDITERKELELEIQEHQIHLESEVNSRTAELATANKELQAFAHSVSHDLKAPLRSIEGFADMLQEDYGERLEETGHDYLSEISDGAIRMGEMVDDLLSHATLGQSFVNVAEVDLDEIINKIRQDLRHDIKEKNAKIQVKDSLGKVTGHKTTLEALLQNILSNAVKYVDPEVRPEVMISRSETEKEYIIAVKDNGIGIEKEHQDKIFGIFQRLHTRDEYPGTGIGLAIAEKAVQLHGGRLWLESEPYSGTTFYFSIDKNFIKPVTKSDD